VHRVRAADRVGRGLGQPDVQNLPLGYEFGQRADGVLDRGARVDTVLVVEIDAISPEPLQ
jgi:hypothetical protein